MAREAHWLANDEEVEPLLRQSDFYMIGGRAEAEFLNLAVDTHKGNHKNWTPRHTCLNGQIGQGGRPP